SSPSWSRVCAAAARRRGSACSRSPMARMPRRTSWRGSPRRRTPAPTWGPPRTSGPSSARSPRSSEGCEEAMNETPSPKLTFAGKLVVFLFIAACLYGAYYLFLRRPLGGNAGTAPSGDGKTEPAKTGGLFGGDAPEVEIGIAYGTEKERWLEWAVGEFAKTDDGKRIRVNLIPMGSLEGAQAVLGGDQRIHVWSPASALYKDVFVQNWQDKNNKNPIVREENLALSPMVFVMWAERHEAFVAKYGEVSFRSLGQALAEPSGWQAIAGKPEWGLFKVGHTHPNQSNSGLMTLVLMAYDYHAKARGLELKDIL